MEGDDAGEQDEPADSEVAAEGFDPSAHQAVLCFDAAVKAELVQVSEQVRSGRKRA